MLVLTASVPAEVCVLVLALTRATTELEAELAVEFVLAFTEAVPAVMADARDVEAVITSDWSASVPEERPAPVIVRVPNDQTWDGVRPFSLDAN